MLCLQCKHGIHFGKDRQIPIAFKVFIFSTSRFDCLKIICSRYKVKEICKAVPQLRLNHLPRQSRYHLSLMQ